MLDKVELLINDQRVDDFESYSVEADIYTPADGFSMTISNPSIAIRKGMACKLLVNGTLELTGRVEKTVRGNKKPGGRVCRVEGRDLMGLVVDHCVEEFIDLEGYTLKRLTEKLLRPIPYINRKNVTYGKGQAPQDTESTVMKIEPGDTTFEVLNQFATARGLMFYLLPDGTFVYGKPKTKGAAEFSLIERKDGKGNNILEGEVTEDLSKQYSKVTVIGQQGGGDVDVDDVNVTGTASDPSFPFYKPLVLSMNVDADSPRHLAKLALDQHRADSLVLSYTVPGHSQDGKNWAINTLCRVEDESREVSGTFLIYGRTFEGGKTRPLTHLRLGLPGILQP